MQSWHRQFSGFHFFTCVLKASMLLTFFSPSGKMFQILGPRNEILIWLEVEWTESSFWGRSVANSFARKVLWQLKEIDHSLFYTFQSQGSGDFDCEQKQSHLFPTAFQMMTVCRNILFASNTRVAYSFCYCYHDYDTSIQGDNS